VNIFVYERNEYEENENPKAVFTTTTSAEKNFNFDIEDLEDGKEYVVIATTDKNWYKNPKGEYLLGQAFIKGGENCKDLLEIKLHKYLSSKQGLTALNKGSRLTAHGSQ
jgi:hypothetical protein